MICDWRPEWNELDDTVQARLKARQGVGNIFARTARVVDTNGDEVPDDAAPDGSFRTGDLGVRHPDGYIELRDRSKDAIISGGENIASIEVEQAIAEHSVMLEVAVIAVPDKRWACSLRHREAGSECDRGGDHRARSWSPGPLPSTEAGGLRQSSEDFQRQDPEIPSPMKRGPVRTSAFNDLPLTGLPESSSSRIFADIR